MLTWILVMAGIALVLGVIWVFTRKPGHFGAGARFPPGTRAFEAEMSLGIIAKMLEAREVALLGNADDEKKATLTRQIANLRRQAEIHQATVDARDLSPGRMSIGVNPDSDTV
ncbi:MAG: hypothetical protein IT378_15995 [Sandaracinaceae bacterium]|nr:hypothetical protein [Sandaracinaceae bacterium]MCC6875810.1 hypothetical protein [Sandaracinaceae bacterium]